MNFHIVLHSLKTDWLRLRWLLAGCWLLILLAAWPAFTFSPEHFDNPPSLANGPYGESKTRSALVAQGEISPVTEWAFLTAKWMLNLVGLFLAGAIGFHIRSWTEGRPLRKWDLIAARSLELVIFLMVPLLAVAPATSLVHGFGIDASWHAFVSSAAILVPKLLAACLFGAICGGWPRWIAGVFVFQLASLLLPAFLGVGRTPLAMFAQPWIPVAVLCGVLTLTSQYTRAWRRIGIAITAVLVAPYLIPGSSATSLGISKNLPDWSNLVEPVLINLELAGTVTSQQHVEGLRISGPPSNQARLQFEFQWETKGLPPGVFAMWNPSGNGNLISENETISSRVPGLLPTTRSNGAGPTGFDKHSLNAAVGAGDNPVKWKAFASGFLTEQSESVDLFGAIEPAAFKNARLETELSGNAYRIVKLLDVPFGRHAEATVEGMRVHVRRLDIVGRWPVADLCYVVSAFSKSDTIYRNYGMFNPDWIPVLHFPENGEYQLLDNADSSQAELATGSVAIRRMYWACQRIHGRKPDTKDFENARFLLLKRENLAILKKQFRSVTLPLVIRDEKQAPDARGFREPPPFQFRPDPATASVQEFNRWMTRSYYGFDSEGWESRNIADYVPRHLDQILQRSGGVQPPSSPEGKAVALACPERRRDEVIAALSRRNSYPQGNWIPDVLIRRGWVREASPQILEMASQDKIGANPYSQVMVMALEDPQTYPAILSERLWLGGYEQARRLPGIEPSLTESLSKRYQEDSLKEGGDSRNRMNRFFPAAAHGLKNAFADLLKAWQSASESDQRVFSENLRKVVLIPGGPNDWKAVVAALAAKVPDDFQYDTLARRWVAVSETSR